MALRGRLVHHRRRRFLGLCRLSRIPQPTQPRRALVAEGQRRRDCAITHGVGESQVADGLFVEGHPIRRFPSAKLDDMARLRAQRVREYREWIL